jgi:DNA ligase 3
VCVCVRNWQYETDHQYSFTLCEMDALLGALVGLTREEQRYGVLAPAFDKFTGDDIYYFARLLDHDLKINIGAKFVLDALHPNAYEAFNKSHDLKAIISRWQNHELENELGNEATFSTGLSLMTPIKPMLAKYVRCC